MHQRPGRGSGRELAGVGTGGAVQQRCGARPGFADLGVVWAVQLGLAPLMGRTRFEFFQIPGSDLPLTWDRMKAPVRSQQTAA